MTSGHWTPDQVKLAFHLYCQLPFGRLHQRTPEVVNLAKLMGRTPSAVAMKMCNLASLDPAIRESGRSGLGNASKLDQEIWEAFHSDWESLALECDQLRYELTPGDSNEDLSIPEVEESTEQDFTGETTSVVAERRVKQNFFRRAVLSGYKERCCMSGLSEPRLLIASHIVPWSRDKKNRLNPSNGLCLSAIHDRAFDKGLLTLSDSYEVLLSEELKRSKEPFIVEVLQPLEGRKINLPERFVPAKEFLARHRAECFVDHHG
jgi:predicted restriction endonuclease